MGRWQRCRRSARSDHSSWLTSLISCRKAALTVTVPVEVMTVITTSVAWRGGIRRAATNHMLGAGTTGRKAVPRVASRSASGEKSIGGPQSREPPPFDSRKELTSDCHTASKPANPVPPKCFHLAKRPHATAQWHRVKYFFGGIRRCDFLHEQKPRR